MFARRFLTSVRRLNFCISRNDLQRMTYSDNSGSNTFNSNICLQNIYPNSSLDITKPPSIPTNTSNLEFSGFIPINKLDITYSRSSGPGGQHVNKVNSKVDLRFKLSDATWMSNEVKEKLREKHPNTINADGFFIVRSERTRSQQLNLADALDKLRYMIHRAIHVIPPPSYKHLEMKRRRQENASRERLRVKRNRSIIKRDRQGLDIDL